MKKYSKILTVILIGFALGLTTFLGIYPILGLTLFLTATLLLVIFKGKYNLLVYLGIVLLSVVFIEPSPSDIIFCSIIPIGIIIGSIKIKFEPEQVIPILMFFSFFVFSLPSLRISTDLTNTVLFYFISLYLLFFAIFISIFTTKKSIYSVLRAYVIAASISIFTGLAGLLGLFPDLFMKDAYRVIGLFKDPNVFGTFFIPAIILLVDDIRHKKIFKTHTIFHLVLITLFSVGVLFSYSRAAWGSLGISLIIYFILNRHVFTSLILKRVFISLFIISGITIGIYFSPLMPDGGIIEFLQDRAKVQDYDNRRFITQKAGLELIFKNPIGYGAGEFENVIENKTEYRLSAHSLYIRIALENGILGFLSFFAAILYILFLLMRKYLKSQRKNIGISPTVLISIISCMLINSFVIDTLHWRHLWFFIGISLFSIKIIREESKCIE